MLRRVQERFNFVHHRRLIVIGAGVVVVSLFAACATVPEDPIALAEKNRIVVPESEAVVGPLILPESHSAKPAKPQKDQANNKVKRPGDRQSKSSDSQQATSQQAKPIADESAEDPTPSALPPAKSTSPKKTRTKPAKPPQAKNQTAASQSKPAPEAQAKPENTSNASVSMDQQMLALSRQTPQDTKAPEWGSLNGVVSLVGEDSEDLKPKGVIVLLESLGGQALPRSPQAETYYIDMEDKTYRPRHLTITKHDKVSFVNKDPIKHNVFSSTGKNAFDLGTYGAGLSREVALNAPGIVKVYCNIHPEMATFIGVSENGLTAITDDKGRFTIDDIQPGRYRVSLWHIRGEVSQTITVRPNETSHLKASINTENPSRLRHTNKFGKKYNKNATIFDDEFY